LPFARFHDRHPRQQYIIDALALNKSAKRRVTYAMLNGINNQCQEIGGAEGETVALYLPFGTRWIGYSYRRLREMGHIRLILHSLFRSQEL
jgi:proline dehydrogenase